MPDYQVLVRETLNFQAGTAHEAVAMARLVKPGAAVLQVSDWHGDCRDYVGICEACRGILLEGDRYAYDSESETRIHLDCMVKGGESEDGE